MVDLHYYTMLVLREFSNEMLDLFRVLTYLSEEIREFIRTVDFTDAFSSAPL